MGLYLGTMPAGCEIPRCLVCGLGLGEYDVEPVLRVFRCECEFVYMYKVYGGLCLVELRAYLSVVYSSCMVVGEGETHRGGPWFPLSSWLMKCNIPFQT